jgi:hypothetical protein
MRAASCEAKSAESAAPVIYLVEGEKARTGLQ